MGGTDMYPGTGPIDCMLNGGDGYLYVALETGSVTRGETDNPRRSGCVAPDYYPGVCYMDARIAL